jgi:hypothetical protein
MLSEAMKRAPDDLDGLPLGEAFRKHVLDESEIAAIGRRISEVRPSNSAVFLEGQFPSGFSFYWPVLVSAESIAYAFVSSPLSFLGEPSPKPSELEAAVSRLLADRIAALIGRLARAEIVAVGTFTATGIEGPVGTGQWRRTDLVIDVENSAICEMRDHRPVAVWTGVCLRLPDLQPRNVEAAAFPAAAEHSTKARKQIQTKSKARRECIGWLTTLMLDPTGTPLTNAELWTEAKGRWQNKLSKREFEKCRAEVLGGLSEEQQYRWRRPGPKRKSSQF